jgi:hypothetical protein
MTQNEIPESLYEFTECGELRSHAGCQFGRNWNDFKDEIAEGRRPVLKMSAEHL